MKNGIWHRKFLESEILALRQLTGRCKTASKNVHEPSNGNYLRVNPQEIFDLWVVFFMVREKGGGFFAIDMTKRNLWLIQIQSTPKSKGRK